MSQSNVLQFCQHQYLIYCHSLISPLLASNIAILNQLTTVAVVVVQCGLTFDNMASKGFRAITCQVTQKVEAVYKPSQTTETLIGYIVCCAFVVYFSVRAVGQTHSLTSFGFSIGMWGLAMCVAEKGWHSDLLFFFRSRNNDFELFTFYVINEFNIWLFG